MTEREQLEQAIAAQEALRPTLGDSVVDAVIGVLRDKLAALTLQNNSEQRKLVTILFADTVSSTQMFETIDPEDVLEIMDGALSAYTAAVDRYEGTVARLMGDGMLAFFGAPIGREDDALRAVRCGLAIVRACQEYAREVERRWHVRGFNVRVGINTGLVALGEVGGAAGSEYTAMGDAINLASRVESNAPPGGVLISHDTYRHVRGIFEVRTLEPLRVKGKSEPVQVYVVEREKPRTFRVNTRGVESIQTRMIGREVELKQLLLALNWAIEEGETQVVTILGEPGVGKSRLLREFDNQIDEMPEDVLHFTGRATMEMTNLPYSLIRDVFAFRFDIQDSDSVAVVREKMERGVRAVMGPDSARQAHYIGHLIGFDFSNSPYLQADDPGQLTHVGQFYLSEFFAMASALHPAVLFLEDIHWADDKSLDLVNHLVRGRRDLRLLVVCLARPTLFERRAPFWTERDEFHTLIELRPLNKDESRTLVEEILRKVEKVPNDLRETIVDTADGNPFYVEELIKMQIEDGVIVQDTDRWWVNMERLPDMRIPPTLTGVLQARLDALPPMERIVLQRASIVGRIFWDSAVSALHAEGEEGIPNLQECLRNLRQRDLIREREQSSLAGIREYIFRHAILKDVTYESVLRRLRRIYHAQVADWLIERSGDRVGEYTGLIAEHYERAGLTERAITYLSRAGEQALNVSAYNEAVSSLEHALELLDADDSGKTTRWQLAQLKWQLGQAYRGLSAYTRAKELYEESLNLFADLKDSEGIVKVLYELGWLVGYILRRYDEGEQYFQESLSIAREINDRRGIAWALNGLGVMAHWQGKHAEAAQHYEESLHLAREIGDKARVAGALNNLGLVQSELGHYEEAKEHLEESLELFREIGNRAGIASPLTNLGGLARAHGQHEEAQRYFAEALAIQREIGDRAGVASTLAGLGSLARLQGAYDLARQRFVESLAILREIGYRTGIAMTLDDLALVARFQGNYEEAEVRLQEILAIARDSGDRIAIANALLNLGAVARVQGRYEEARHYLQESLSINQEINNRNGIAWSLDYLGDMAFEQGQHETARRYYSESLAIYREFDNRSGIVISLGGLGYLSTEIGDYEEARQYFHDAFTTASSIRDTPLTLWVLVGIAMVLAKEGEKERSVELLGLVLDHYATPQEARDKAEALLAQLRSDLDMPVLNAALERGQTLALDAMQAARRRLGVDGKKWLT
jgi:class 3 adenylate cyclase/tetratricopeptide (TPR) repeat protein